MTINGINGTNPQMGQMGMNQATDSYSRNIQNQIADAQKQLQELSSNENMSLEESLKVNFQTIYWWQYRKQSLRYAGV